MVERRRDQFLGDELEEPMTPELWVALVVGVVPTVGTVAVTLINRARRVGLQKGEAESSES